MGKSTFSIVGSSMLVIYASLLYQLHGNTIGPLETIFLGVVGVLSLLLTLRLIPLVMPLCIKKGLSGKDLNKTTESTIPESLGIVTATVYMIAVVSFQWVFRDSLGIYNAALLSMSMMLYLGFADDVLDIKWSVKIFFSFVAAIPLLLAYTGTTTIIIPKLLHGFLPASLELGFLYQFYMACMAVFCTNSINIFAGVNGLESGQSVVIAFSILVHNFLQLSFGPTHEIQQHILSIFLVFPFAATSMGLMYFNWYPSQVFVGDSFTYFAGITFAVAGVLGHFSKTLMIMFIPQLINFAYSLPQLFHKITGIDCPRHRLPRLNHKTGFLEPSRNAQGHMNMTLINLFLKIFGPMNERNLCLSLLVFQVISTAIALSIRYQFEHVYY